MLRDRYRRWYADYRLTRLDSREFCGAVTDKTLCLEQSGMGRNRSLDEFSDTDSGATDGEQGPATGTNGDSEAKHEDDPSGSARSDDLDGTGSLESGSTVQVPDEKLTPVYDSSPAGEACHNCGAVVDTRWRQDDGYVCTNCKDW